MLLRFLPLLLVVPSGATMAGDAPTGLLCDLKKSPAVGVRAAPSFSWIVPPCGSASDQLQVAYEVVVLSDDGLQLWDSGKVTNGDSTYVPYTGPALAPATRFSWTVTTWTAACESPASAQATFVTAPWTGWDVGAQFLTTPNAKATFGYFRTELIVPAGVASAIAFVAAEVDDRLLSGYKLYVNDVLANLGPGRGEAPVFKGDGAFRALPITTLDLSPFLSAPGPSVLALQAMHESSPRVIFQLIMKLTTGEQIIIVSNSSWHAFDGDVHRNPTPGSGSAGVGYIEHIDARFEPVGWRAPGFVEDSAWAPAVGSAPSTSDLQNLYPRMQPAMQVIDRLDVISIVPLPGAPQTYLADFGREFQGGLRLSVQSGSANTTIQISCGEALSGTTVTYTWGWSFTWTLRDGLQVLEQHKYMECRFVSLVFSPSVPDFNLTAWRVSYPWDDGDSSFISSSASLNAVYDLCRYTLFSAALDTYTDSNTRERTPYEADGVIAASGRLLLQRDFMWPRHSHAFVIQNPTWPVEWQQLSPFLGWQDYMNTGQPDLALAFEQEMHDRTKISFLDPTLGVLNTNTMGRHIVDWMPDGDEADETVKRHEFTDSNHTSVSNAFGAHGLSLLATMMAAGGRTSSATQYNNESTALMAAIMKHMWNGTAFCDGICSEVAGASLVMTNMFTLAFGMVPLENIPAVFSTVTNWGLEQMGDYGAFWYQMSIASGYYAPYYDTPDDGSAMVLALTKCDTYSWCSGLRDDNLTMTRESWHDGTYSHGWGSSAIVGVSWGIAGVHVTSPGWATFTVKPKLGNLTFANITVPSIRGFISVAASPGAVDVVVPCNSKATLCAPRSAGDSATVATHALLLDGREIKAVESGGHMCAPTPLGCGVAGSPRQLRVQSRNRQAL